MSSKKEQKRILDEAQRQGFSVEDKGRRYKIVPPGGGRPYFTAKTPSDARAVDNVIAALRKFGLQWPPKSKKEQRSQRRKKRGKS